MLGDVQGVVGCISSCHQEKAVCLSWSRSDQRPIGLWLPTPTVKTACSAWCRDGPTTDQRELSQTRDDGG